MLRPETRTLLSDALRPPLGFQVDLAVATTYSLDLTAMLLAPMTFALHDDDVSDLDTVDPIKLLEAVRRYADLTTVFAQAGAIAVPSSYRRILTFAEDCVHEVSSPSGLFHPKTWTLRFSDGHGSLPAPPAVPEPQPDLRPLLGHRAWFWTRPTAARLRRPRPARSSPSCASCLACASGPCRLSARRT